MVFKCISAGYFYVWCDVDRASKVALVVYIKCYDKLFL